MRNLWPGSRSAAIWLILIIITVSTIIRFVNLDSAPKGFFIDEADGAVHTMCISQTGHDGGGVHLPLFSAAGAGGFFSPVHMYFGVLWTKVFGESTYSLRAIAALMTTLTMLGLFFLAKNLMDQRGALLVTLAACVSPWAFPFARQSMDDPTLFTLGLVWGTFFFIRSHKIRDGILAALFYSIAFYSYSPSRIQIPLLGIALLFYKRRRQGLNPGFLFVFILTGILACIPLLLKVASGDMLVRYNVVGIFSPWYREKLGTNTVLGAIRVLSQNYLTHFKPNYLFIHGDGNLRHSSQFSGELSWLDDLALVAGLGLLIKFFFFDLRKQSSPLKRFLKSVFFFRRAQESPTKFYSETFVLFAVGFLAGVLPAALTWESLPHALRSVGSWPFVCLMTGFILWKGDQSWKYFLLPSVVVAAIFGALYLDHYFTVYPETSAAWYDASVKVAAEEAQKTGRWKEFTDATKNYGTFLTRRYYLMHYGHFSCDQSLLLVK